MLLVEGLTRVVVVVVGLIVSTNGSAVAAAMIRQNELDTFHFLASLASQDRGWHWRVEQYLVLLVDEF